MPSTICRLPLVIAAAGLPAIALADLPTEWEITLVARSSVDAGIPAYRLPPFTSLSSQPVSIDENGGVAIRAFISGNPSEGVFYGDADSGGLVITANNPSEPVFSGSVDAYGGRIVVADATFGAGGATVYDTDGNMLQRFDPGGPLAISGIGSPTLSADGAIAYRGDFGFVGDRVVIDEFIGGNRDQTPIADDFSGIHDFLLTPRMNANRQVVINTIPNTGPSRRILRYDFLHGTYLPFTIAETGAGYDSFVNSTGIGNDGSVSFTARRSADGVREVILSSPTGVYSIIATGGQDTINNSNLANFPPVNNANGLVAFRVEDGSGSTSLYVGDGTDLVRILKNGDLVDTDLGPIAAGFDFGGLTGIQTINSNIDINDNDQVAFSAFLENGTIGVFVASPVTGPEPCNAADFAEPLGSLDFNDVVVFLSAFSAMDPAADLADPIGAFDFNDVVAFLNFFSAGCP